MSATFKSEHAITPNPTIRSQVRDQLRAVRTNANKATTITSLKAEVVRISEAMELLLQDLDD